MPIYVYKCVKCKAEEEKLVRNTSEYKVPACEKCGGELKKTLAPFDFVMKI